MTTVITSVAEIGPALRTLRMKAGLTIERLALKADVSTATVAFIETGRRMPSPAMLLSLLSVLGAELSISERRDSGQAALAEALLVS